MSQDLDDLPAIERALRVLGRPTDGYGGASALARALKLPPGRVLLWRKRGWVTPRYAIPIERKTGGFVTAEHLIADARRLDGRNWSRT